MFKTEDRWPDDEERTVENYWKRGHYLAAIVGFGIEMVEVAIYMLWYRRKPVVLYPVNPERNIMAGDEYTTDDEYA